MASNHTSNYGLCQWEATDAVLRTDFNEDNQKIDTVLKTQAGSISDLTAQMANKANTGAVNSLAEKVALKADQSDLDAEKAAREAADTENMQALRSENCWVKLSDETLSGPTESYMFSFSNAASYSELMFRYTMESTGSLQLSLEGAQMIPVGSNPDVSTQIFILGASERGMGGYFRLYPIGMTDNIIIESRAAGLADNTRCFIPDQYLCTLDKRYSELKTLTLLSVDGSFQVGSRFILYGLKK